MEWGISIGYDIALTMALVWTTGFSLVNKPPLRGLRNIGILACYVLGIVMFIQVPWRVALVTWAQWGVLGAFIYIGYERFLPVKEGAERPPLNLGHFLSGQYAWPIMIPEAIEYALADMGILKAEEENISSKQDASDDT